MTIIDINGKFIEVKNLEDAIAITAQYKDYRHKDKPLSEADAQRQAYWTDLYEKLIRLKELERVGSQIKIVTVMKRKWTPERLIKNRSMRKARRL